MSSIPVLPAAPAPTVGQPPEQLIPRLTQRLCAVGWRPYYLTGLFRDICIRHFYDAENQVEDSDFRGLVWRPDQTTNILIESLYRWRPELTEFRPAILIKRNAYKNLRLGIGMGNLGADRRGDYSYANFVVGSHTLFCLGHTASTADGLASEVVRHLTMFAPAYRRFLHLFQLQVTEVGAANDLDEADYVYAVPVDVGWAYEEQWTLAQEALPLVRVSLSLLTES